MTDGIVIQKLSKLYYAYLATQAPVAWVGNRYYYGQPTKRPHILIKKRRMIHV